MADSELIRGNIDIIILKVLYEGDRYGYDMIKQINAKSSGQWEIKQPTLYACLKRLEKQDFIKSYWDASESNGGRRKYYTLSDLGKEVFLKYKDEYERSRDLFGSLMSDETTVLAVDDFSDVEDESYAIPKRRVSKPRTKKKPTQDEQPNIINDSDTASFFDYSHSYTVQADDATQRSDDTSSQAQTANSVRDESATAAEEPQAETASDYVQQSFFDSTDSARERSNDEVHAEESENSAQLLESETVNEKPAPMPPIYEEERQTTVREAADPRAIIDGITTSYSGGESYASASGKEVYDTYFDEREPAIAEPVMQQAAVLPKPAVQNAVKEPTPVAPIAPVSPARSAAVPAEQNYLPADINSESLARSAYREVLTDLIERCDTANDSPREEQAAAEAAVNGEKIEVRRFGDVVQTVTELGNEVTVRDHNDSAKVYTHKYYYYSNKLLIRHYPVMALLMFLFGTVLFLSFRLGLNMRMRYDYVLYILAGLLPVMMLIAAVIIFITNPDKKTRINVNFRLSLIIRIAVMIQVLVIIYLLNVIWGMPVGFSASYIPSLVIPGVYALFIPISEVIFMTLLKSERFAVE